MIFEFLGNFLTEIFCGSYSLFTYSIICLFIVIFLHKRFSSSEVFFVRNFFPIILTFFIIYRVWCFLSYPKPTDPVSGMFFVVFMFFNLIIVGIFLLPLIICLFISKLSKKSEQKTVDAPDKNIENIEEKKLD